MPKNIEGFSKFNKEQKVNWIASTFFSDQQQATRLLKKYWNTDLQLQKLHDDFIENTITNFYLPLGVAPNFLINQKYYAIPMAVEESSVVAAASNAAKFWENRGGFKTQVINTEKTGQVHFLFKGDKQKLLHFFNYIKPKLIVQTDSITKNMRKRGGGILDIELKDKTHAHPNYYQLHATFDTLDAMGANFINSCLEQFAKTLQKEAHNNLAFSDEDNLEIIMSIVSNYAPNCLVKASVSCPIEALSEKGVDGLEFARKFQAAVSIANVEPYRAVTHNKGVMNGVDAVIIATGNDFRAVEAGAHAYAVKNGQYKSLTNASINNGVFKFWIEIPITLGTVGGLTALHPLARLCLEMLDNPSAKQLMQIVAVAGLAQNFAAIRSLITTGIQKGHMKMHLKNILNQLKATKTETEKVIAQFGNQTISHKAVCDFVEKIRS